MPEQMTADGVASVSARTRANRSATAARMAVGSPLIAVSRAPAATLPAHRTAAPSQRRSRVVVVPESTTA